MNILSPVIEKSAALIPIHLQIKSAHILQKVKQCVIKSKSAPVFIETLIPDVTSCCG